MFSVPSGSKQQHGPQIALQRGVHSLDSPSTRCVTWGRRAAHRTMLTMVDTSKLWVVLMMTLAVRHSASFVSAVPRMKLALRPTCLTDSS